MKRNMITVLITITITIGLTAGIVKASQVLGVDMIQTGSLKVGTQGLGGVTFFNGTIVNETSTNGVDNPVTFGDNVRIDGTIQRGDESGPGDGFPVKIDDDVEVLGSLTVAGQTITAPRDFTPEINNLQGQINTTNGTIAIHSDQISGTIGTNDEQATQISNTIGTNDTQATQISDLEWWQGGLYHYQRCVLNLDDQLLWPTMSTMLFCWDTWLGTDYTVLSTVSPLSLQSLPTKTIDFDQAIQLEQQRRLENDN